MDCLTFISKIIEACAWPIAAVAIVFGFRDQLKALLPLIKKFKAGPVEVELEQIKKELGDTKAIAASTKAKVDVIEEKFDESEKETEFPIRAPKAADASNSPLSDVETKVLKAMCNSPFATRTLSGVARETGLTKPTVQSIFGSLISKALADQTKNKDGQPRWFVTSLGRIVANEN
jgi:hypothetical protein